MLVKKNDKKNVLIAFAINAIFLLLVIMFCDMKYEVSDDFIVDSILSGAYGNGYDEHLLFSNILYGYFLKLLYQLIPVVSWYFVAQIAICFCSLWAVSYIILQKNNSYIGILVIIIFVSFFSDDLYILVQFTKTAVVAICAGGALMLYGIWRCKKRRNIEILLGGGLALLGSMVRFNAMYIALVFLAIIMFRYIYQSCKIDRDRFKIFSAILICVGYVGCAFLIYRTDGFIWNQNQEYKNYKIYNEQRASVTDVNSYGYDSVGNELEKIEISENDYDMINSWNFVDQDYFSTEKLKKIAEVKKSYSDSVTQNVKYIIQQFIWRHYEKYTVTIGLLVLFFCAFFLDKRKRIWQFWELGVTAFLLMYFIYRGRVVYRVEYAIFVCAAISMATTLQANHKLDLPVKRIIIGCGILVCVCKIPLYIPDRSYQKLNDEEYAQYISDCFYESWNFKIEKYRCCVSKRRPHEALMKLIENDTEHYYLIDFNTGIQLVYYNYKPWIRINKNAYDRYSYFGGVTIGYPDNYTIWEKHDIDGKNPYRSIDNNNICIVDTMSHEIRLNYIHEHYNPDEKKKLLNRVSGFDIWEYSR